MMETDEAGTLTLLEYHNEVVRRHTDQERGTIIKTIGDAFMVDFPNTNQAVKCAIAIQNELGEYNQHNPNKALVLRIGIHLGDIYFYDNDALGEGINIASRLQGLCNPGRICISQDVYNLTSNKIEGPEVRELGAVKLKNITREIRAYEIMTHGAGPEEPKKQTKPQESTKPNPHSTATQTGATHTTDQPSHGPQHSPALDAQGIVDVHKLKTLVLEEVKRLGSRLSVQQVRRWYPAEGAPGLDDALDALAERGYLARKDQSSDSTSTNSTGASRQSSGYRTNSPYPSKTDEAIDKGIQEFKKATIEIGRELRNAFRSVDQWFAQPQSTGLTLPPGRSTGSDESKDKKLEKQWDRALETRYPQPDHEQIVVAEYRKQTESSLDSYRKHFSSHLGSYIGVNAMLAGIWAFTGASFPWFLIPLLAWGIGMSGHWINFQSRKQEAQELRSLPGLTKAQLFLVRKFHKLRNKFRGNTVSTLATSVFLFTLNMITSPMVPWSFIPIGIMSITTFASIPSNKAKQSELLEDLAKEGVPTAILTSAKERKSLLGFMGDTKEVSTPLEMEAVRLRAVILSQLTSSTIADPLGPDFPQLLDDYVDQIGDLSRKIRDIQQLEQEFSPDKLQQELRSLETQRDQVSNQNLKQEYSKGIDQIRKQLDSYEDLQNQEKVIALRLANAMNSLRQVQLELVRMNTLGSKTNANTTDQDLLSRTQRLDTYVDDLRAGYHALESADFAELEKYRDS